MTRIDVGQNKADFFVALCGLCVELFRSNAEDIDEVSGSWEGGGPNVGVHSARGGQEC
jgi:hypothetical protein